MKTVLCWILFLSLMALFYPKRAWSRDFLKEDWIYVNEPTHPTHWGIRWGLTNLMLPNRILIRGKHTLENKYANNWKFNSGSGSFKGGLLRFLSSGIDFAAFMGTINLHHDLGHDAAAREMNRTYGQGIVPDKFSQVLPVYLGGKELDLNERQTQGGADAQSWYMAQPMSAENLFAYEAGKEMMMNQIINRSTVGNYIIYRYRFMQDRLEENGELDQSFASTRLGICVDNCIFGSQGSSSKISTDFTNYLISVNGLRYGVTDINQYKLKMNDIRRAYLVQLADPVQWIALWQYGKDYIGKGKNQTHIPMIPLGSQIGYLPSVRVFFSPFGVEYVQDNYFRYKGSITNIYWTKGDDKYEKRFGFGIDITNVKIFNNIILGTSLEMSRQPLLTRILDQTALSASETGQRRTVYNVGGSIKVPVWYFNHEKDPSRLFLYARLGQSNGWFPSEYLNGGTNVQIGLGLRH